MSSLIAIALFALSFSECASYVSMLTALPLWLLCASLNSLLAIAVLMQGRVWEKTACAPKGYAAGSPRNYLPGTLVLLTLFLWVRLYPTPHPPSAFSLTPLHLCAIFWIPFVEEIVFRRGISPCLRYYSGPFWGSYLTVLLFAGLHGNPTWAHLRSGEFGMPLGPLLLGAVSEGLYRMTRSLGSSIWLHMACNATAVLLPYGDLESVRWLRWLYVHAS